MRCSDPDAVLARSAAIRDHGRGHVDAQITGHRWQVVTTTVVAMHNGPLTVEQARRAAVLTARSPAAACAWTSLAQHGLQGWDRDEIHVVVPRGARPVAFGALRCVVHESRRFVPADVCHAASVPRTSVERSAVDAAVWSSSARAACGVLAAVVQQRLSSAARLEAELLAAGRVRHRRLLLAALTDMAGGAQAVSELDFLRFCRRHHLGRPRLQQVRRDAAGRRRYLDATLVARSGREVRVEIDGALHLAVRTYWDDMRRGNDLWLVGQSVLRFPSTVVHADDPDAVRQLRAAVAS